jgi:alpha-N-arabinofuranosidase
MTLDPAFAVGDVDPRLFGSFVEHLGRCVYTGIFEPDHPTADESGLRQDVLTLIRELGVTVVRYPGGNFVSGYRWEDGIGPVSRRPARLDLAWRSLETNRFGLGEFMNFVAAAGAEPMLAANLGTRGVRAACDLLEYCNHPAGTRWADLRVAHGAAKPYGVGLWCLGNEMDGPWQIGHKTAAEYGRLAAETARAMRMIDPGVQLVACGSSNSAMPTFGSWEATVLEETYDLVDFVSLHAYYEELGGDADSFLASAADMEHFIESVVATCDHIRARTRSRKRLRLSFDEWNVWYLSRFQESRLPEWEVAPRLIEDRYSVTDAVVVGSLLVTLLRHCDRIGVACLAQLVNVIAPIVTEPGGRAVRQTTFYPFAQASRHGRGRVLRVEPHAPVHETARYGEVPLLHATATADDATGEVTLFAVNRDRTRPLALTADLRALPAHTVIEHLVLADDDPAAANTLDAPDRVVPRRHAGTRIDDATLSATLPPLSWNVIRLSPKAAE